MFYAAKKGRFIVLNIICNILATTNGATAQSSSRNLQSEKNILKKSTSISKAQRACKEGHPNWHNNGTSRDCDSSLFVQSCKNNCGGKRRCFCDLDCLYYGDCCPDFIESCLHTLSNETKILDINRSERGKYDCEAINGTMYVYLKSSCDLAHHDSSLEVSCKTPKHYNDEIISQTPAVDPETGIMYKNIDCARCNNVKKPKLWAIQTICEDRILTDHDVKNPDMNFIKKILNSKSCASKFIPPDNARVRSCVPTEYKCPSCADEGLSELCATSGLHPVQAPTDEPNPVPGIVYHNKFCWFCANPTAMNHQSCHINLGYRSSATLELFSFQILVDVSVDNKRSLNVRPSSGIQSVGFELECTAESSCMAVACPDGYVKNGGRCAMIGKLVQTIVRERTLLNYDWEEHVKILEDLLHDTFIPTGYIDYDHIASPTGDQYNIDLTTIMRFNVSFPENVPNHVVDRNMKNRYETFVLLAEEKSLSQINMTYKIVQLEAVNPHDPEPVLNSTSSCASVMPLLVTSGDIFLIIIITFSL
ncbi:unnamed protein product [Owenia fusiformis]|uniref:Uncharacterized protein n=1 Tax=Owenia fusiformis TaxID=6347 RepID=A0A8J1UHE2_OWEFU|nr:unnamed protein product [Owenia fusiformis]